MGDVVRRGTRSKPRFYVRYVELNGQRVQRAAKGARTEGEAQTILAAAELRVSQGRVGMEEITAPSAEELARSTMTVSQLAAKFLDEDHGYRSPKVKDMASYRRSAKSKVKVRITPLIGSPVAVVCARVQNKYHRRRTRAR